MPGDNNLPALILRGNLELNGINVCEQVIAFKLMATRDDIVIPATLCSPKTHRGGSPDYSIQIDYLSTDEDGIESVFSLFWNAIADSEGLVDFEGTFRDEPASPTNPAWAGTFLVTGAGIGGAAQTASQDSQTFPMTGPPTRYDHAIFS